MPKNKPSMQLNLPFWQSIVLFLTASVIALPANAQVDAGALQQNLEQQLPLPSPLALPQPGKPEPLQQTAPKDGETRFVVKSFVVEGINILPEVQIQEVLRPWVSRSVNFDDLQKACDAVIDYYRKNGYTVQAGVFLQAENAGKLLAQLKTAGVPAYLETRVQIGPFKDKASADAAAVKLKRLGISPVVRGN